MTKNERLYLRDTILRLYDVDIFDSWWQSSLDLCKVAKIEDFIDGYGYRCTIGNKLKDAN